MPFDVTTTPLGDVYLSEEPWSSDPDDPVSEALLLASEHYVLVRSGKPTVEQVRRAFLRTARKDLGLGDPEYIERVGRGVQEAWRRGFLTVREFGWTE